MKTYENTRTGAVIRIASELSGEDWKEVKSTKKTTAKKGE